jgi:hypothetical protein
MKNQDWKTQIKRNTKNLALWTTAWTLSMALATFGPKFIWDGAVTLTVIGVTLNALLGVGMIVANIRHLKGLDELEKKIHLEGMGLALGVGIVGGLSYSLLDTTNLIAQDAEISFFVMLIGITYLLTVLIGYKRYA